MSKPVKGLITGLSPNGKTAGEATPRRAVADVPVHAGVAARGVFGRGGYSARIIWHGSSGSLSGPSRPFHLPWREKSVLRPSAMA